jgi:Kef-type K+ transport system membrane component KefB
MTVHQSELLLFFTLLQLGIIVLAGRVGGGIAIKIGQSAVVGEIILGILLGPSLFGMIAPDLFAWVFHSTSPGPLSMLSQIGLIFLMFQIGQEFDFSHLKISRHRNTMISVAVASMVAPFILGFGFGYLAAPVLSPDANQFGSALFVGTAFSITALPILGRIMIEFGITNTAVGVIAISAAAINDVIGWILLALVSALTISAFSPESLGWILFEIVIYIAVCWLGVRPLMKNLINRLGTDANPLSNNVLGAMIVLIFLSAMTTYKIGIFAIFGGFMLGVLVHDETAFVAAWRKKVGAFVTVFFLPIFFTYTGLRTSIGSLDTPELWGWCLLLILLATLGKFGAAYWAARFNGLSKNESTVIGVMMNTRALMELIVINIGLDLGVISPKVFTMLVIMAIFSTILTTPVLRKRLPALGLGT